MKALHSELSEKIIACAFQIINELGSGFLESVYEKAMLVALKEEGIKVISQHPIQVYFHEHIIGEFYADLFVDEKILVELKASKSLKNDHYSQIINYLNATKTDVGLLINFGNPKLEFKRFKRKGLK